MQNHGFTSVPGSSTKVTLKCKLDQEMWQCEPNIPILAGHLYTKLCAMVPVHGIFGQRPDMYSNETRDRFFDGKDGRVMASWHIIPKSGHLVVQEKPDMSAELIASISHGIQKDLMLPVASRL